MKTLLIAGAAIALTATPAAAQIRLAVHQWNPKAAAPDSLVTLAERPDSVETLLRQAWDAVRGPGCDAIKAAVPSKVTAHFKNSAVPMSEFVCDLGPASSAVVTSAGQVLTMKLHVPTSKVRLKLVLKGFGRPDFFIDMPFALDITVKATGGQQGYLLKVVSVDPALAVGDVKVDGASIAGDAVLAVANVANLNVSKMIAEQVQKQSIPVGNVVARINDLLGAGAPMQTAIAGSRLWYRGGRLIVVIEPPVTPLRGTVSGVITAPADGPTNCSGIDVTISSTGPGKMTDPFALPPQFARGDAFETSGASGSVQPQSGGGIRCLYKVTNVPIGSKPEAGVPNMGQNQLGKVAKVGPTSQNIQIPSSTVNFQMAWGVGGSGSFFESKFKPQIAPIKPGGQVMGKPGGAVTRTLPGGTVSKAPPVAKTQGKAPVIKAAPVRVQ